jgi:hypothetical protein
MAASVDAPTLVFLRWLRLGRRATEAHPLGERMTSRAKTNQQDAAGNAQ